MIFCGNSTDRGQMARGSRLTFSSILIIIILKTVVEIRRQLQNLIRKHRVITKEFEGLIGK
jgi:hypothetical protein